MMGSEDAVWAVISVHIGAAIEKELAARTARTQVTSDEVVRELQRIGMVRLDHAVSWDNERLVLVPSEQLSEDTAAAVASVRRGKYVPAGFKKAKGDLFTPQSTDFWPSSGRVHRPTWVVEAIEEKRRQRREKAGRRREETQPD